jgi:hypothetical protein
MPRARVSKGERKAEAAVIALLCRMVDDTEREAEALEGAAEADFLLKPMSESFGEKAKAKAAILREVANAIGRGDHRPAAPAEPVKRRPKVKEAADAG